MAITANDVLIWLWRAPIANDEHGFVTNLFDMVFKYKRKTEPPSKERIQQGLASAGGGMSVSASAKTCGISVTTLRRHNVAVLQGVPLAPRGGHPSLPPETEIHLATLVKVAGECGFGFTMEQIKVFVGSYVREKWDSEDDVGRYLRSYCRFGEHKLPGKDWMKSFMTTHHLSLLKPDKLEKFRKLAESDPFNIYHFYDLLAHYERTLGLANHPERIWNLDESAFFVDPQGGKVVAETGTKTQRVTSGPGRQCFTVMACVSAAGRSLPPMFIFEGKHLYTSWKGTSPCIPPETTYSCSGKSHAYIVISFITSCLFLAAIKYYIYFPSLLV